MASIFLEGAARALILLHAAAAIVLIGASTHHAWICLLALRGKPRPRLMRIYAAVQATAMLTTLFLGALSYPSFRYYVRGLYLDRYAPWASNLFDLKEHLAALALPLVIGAYVLGRSLDPARDRAFLPTYAALVIASAAVVWFNVISGLLITMVRAQ